MPILAPILESFLELDQAVLDVLPIGIYACDADGQILKVNRKAIELWGRAPRLLDPTQRFCASFRMESLAGEFIAADRTPMARAVIEGEGCEGVETIVQNRDGRRWIARATVALLRDENGIPVGAINCFQDVTREHAMRAALEQQQKTFDLAMIASRMGTWRYTMADNVCIYDGNAQALYGLTKAAFLHDDEGVKDKFHPDDLAVMWERVAKALQLDGDGKYEVEYRVKQRDGSWRWLSAWGLVEFEGQGENRKPIAIAGASRDLTELKQAEELQQLLINELNHRVKNTLATVQSIAAQTIRGATDLQAARSVLDGRIVSLARAHDLLTERSWAGADLIDVASRAMQPFRAGQIAIDGPSIDLPPKHALALSLALHELATNASKYGALSQDAGRVAISWQAQAEQLSLVWQEFGGPPVVGKSRIGFGTRMLEDVLTQDLDGETLLEFAPEGLRCAITASLEARS
ncbi:HWE histidine kinase domain-containing protein [Bradyrhizobium sp. 1]|uniref:sensor histidine kinase n=1 Tax=Bradyrhizobium sp. 1 TaxID=241591 RepID=UPI001FFB92F5|nr:HWE histidine kinase domain-containing protein [Bradyrhizobium sp. 1]MCK1392652.1 PAS domain S-box protein [Bradyrhizobium sp. 1]